MTANFVYMDESNIPSNLKCDICKKPCINPVSLPSPCEQTFCLQCIQSNLQDHPNHCSACLNKTLTNEHFHTESRIRKIVDHLLVQCSLCNQDKIQRIQCEQHLNESCAKQIISCSGKDIKCQWTGCRDQLDEHLKSCPYQKIRDDLEQLIYRSELLEQLQTDFQNLQHQCQQIENQNQIFKKQIKQIQLENQRLNEQTTEQINQIKQLNEQIDQLKPFETETQRLKEQSIEQMEQINQLNEQITQLKPFETETQRLKEQSIEQMEQISQLNERIDQSKPFETENERLNEQLKSSSIEIKKLEEENQVLNKELTQLKESDIKDLMKQIDELKHWKDGYQAMENQSKQYKIQIKKLENSLEALNQTFQENLKTLNSTQIENDHFRQLFQQKMPQIDSLTEQNESLNQQIQYLNNEYQKICQQSQEQQIKLDFLQKENQSLKEEIVDYQFQIEYRDIKIKQLQTKPLLQSKDLSMDHNYENNQLKELINQYERNSLINLNGEQLNDHDIDIVINNALAYKKCHSILLWNNSLTINSTSKLFSSLKWNKTLTKLSISNNPLADVSMKYLYDALAYNNQTLQELILSSNEITDQGLIYFSDVFKSNKTLITIGLQHNRISDQSIQYFSKILSSYQNGIENLSLYCNELITDLSVQSCLKIIEKKIPLKTFWIWDCQLSKQGKDHIRQSIQPHIHLELKL